MPPQRPTPLNFSTLQELYRHFEAIFLNGNSNSYEFVSSSGDRITVFDHHFFHMVKLALPSKEKLFMKDEKEKILAQVGSFGDYTFDKQRALHLPSAMETLKNPDHVYTGCSTLKSAEKVFIKEFDSLPYPYTIVLVGKREGDLLVPVTSYPHRRGGMGRFRKGETTYPKNNKATD